MEEQDIMVVSEMGEVWSPKTAPPAMAPTIRGMGVPKLTAIGNRMGIIMAMVPALVPVEKEMIQVKRNATAEKMAGAINLVSREERYPAVPSWLIIPLSV